MARGIEQDQAFVDEFAVLVPDARARAAIIAGIENTLAEVPTVGEAIDTKADSCWLAEIPEAPGWGTARMILLYSFDDEFLRLHWIYLA